MSSKGKKRPNKSVQREPPGASGSEQSGSQDTGQGDEHNEQNAMEKFERELYWCIQQLRLGLETQNPDSRQAKDATKILKILLNPKAVMVKKRQVMRATFGDYRKKMQEEEKQSAAAAKRMKLSAVNETTSQKSQFYKKSTAKSTVTQSNESTVTQSNELGTTLNQSGNAQSVSAEDKSETDLNTSFKFNFTISDNSCGAEVKPATDGILNTPAQAGNSRNDGEAGQAGNSRSDGEADRFTFRKSENSFKFNFEIKSES